MFLNKDYYVSFDKDFSLVSDVMFIGLFSIYGPVSYTTFKPPSQSLKDFIKNLNIEILESTDTCLDFHLNNVPVVQSMIRQGLTAHEKARAPVKEEEKKTLPEKDTTTTMTGDIFEKNKLLPFKEWRKPKGMSDETMKKLHNQRGFAMRKLKEDVNPTTTTGRDKIKAIGLNDLNMERAFKKIMSSFVKATIRNSVGVTLPHDYTFKRTMMDEDREIVSWKYQTGVRAGAAFSINDNRVLSCVSCGEILQGFYKRQECTCVLSKCARCNWISMVKLEDIEVAVRVNDFIKIHEQNFDGDGLKADLIFEIPDLSGDYFDVLEKVKTFFVGKTTRLCVHAYDKLRKEYVVPCWCGFYGDGHICNCFINIRPKQEKLRNFGEVVFKQMHKFGLNLFYNDMLLGTPIDDVVYVVWNCSKHRGHEIYRCKECRLSYNNLINGRFDGYTSKVERKMVKQGDTDESMNTKIQNKFTQPSKSSNDEDEDITDDQEVDLDVSNKVPVKFVEVDLDKPRGPNIRQKATTYLKHKFNQTADKLQEKLSKSFITKTLGKPGKILFEDIGLSTITAVASVLLDALHDDSRITWTRLNIYLRVLMKEQKFQSAVRPLLEVLIPSELIDTMYGPNVLYFYNKALASEAVPYPKSLDIADLVNDGWAPMKKKPDFAHMIEFGKVLHDKDFISYIKVKNELLWGTHRMEAQGDGFIPDFIFDVIKKLARVNVKEATQKLVFLNQAFNIFKTVKDFFKFVLGCLPTFLNEFFLSDNEKEWLKMCKDGGEVSKFAKMVEFLLDRDNKGFAIHDMHFRPAATLWHRITALISRLIIEDSRTARKAEAWMRTMNHKWKVIVEKHRPGNPREMEPLWFELVGKSGIGKSSMMEAVVSAVYGVPISKARDDIYTRGATTHYDGLRTQKVFVYDDFDATTLEGLAHQQIIEIFLLISNCAVPAPMASIAEKGTELNPELVFTLSNHKVETCPDVPATEALMRRKTASMRVVSTGKVDYTNFSHLRFISEPPQGVVFSGRKTECECTNKTNGVCFIHLDDYHYLDFKGFVTFVKAHLLRKKAEHQRRIKNQKEVQFETLLDNVEFIFQASHDEEDDVDNAFYTKHAVPYVNKNLFKGWDLKSICITGIEWIETLTTYCVNICAIISGLSITLLLSGAVVKSINDYMKGNVNDVYILEMAEIEQQSEGKTDRRPKQHIRLQGDSNVNHLLDGLVYVKFRRNERTLKACGYVIGKRLYCNFHITGFDEQDDDSETTELTLEWKKAEKTLTILRKDIRKLRKFTNCEKHEGRYDCPYCMTSYNDIIEVNLENQNLVPFRTRLQYFMSSNESLPRYMDNVTLYSIRNGVIHGTSGNAKLNTMLMPDGKEKVSFLTLKAISEVGDCGGIYVYKGRIIAMHFGMDVVGSSALGQIVVQEQLKPIQFEVPELIQQGAVSRSFASCTGLGKLPRAVHRSTKTDIKPSLIQNYFGPRTTEPTILSKYDKRANGIDPFEEGIRKYDVTGRLPSDFNQDDFVNILHSTFFNDKQARVLTEEEAINGCEEYGLPPIDMTKSAGFGYKPSANGKRSLFKLGDDGKYEVSDPILRNNIDNLLNKKNDGVALLPISQATLKDERVKPGKKTRVFNNFPVEYTIVGRMFLGSFIGCAHSWYDRSSYFSIGINLYSTECNRFMNDLLRVSDVGFDGDYKDYDLSLPFGIVDSVYKAIGKWCGYDISIPSMWFLHPIVAFDDEVFIQHDGNTSGNLMTTLVNSIAGFGLLWLAYNGSVPSVLRDLRTFEENVAIKTFGDDNIVMVSRKIIRLFHIQVVKDYLKKLGITYTRADKKDEGKVIPFNEEVFRNIELGKETEDELDLVGLKRINTRHTRLEFLKNTFRYSRGNWYALLRESVITEMTYWIRSKTYNWTDLDDEAMIVNINTALRFRYFYGKPEFDMWREGFLQALREVSEKRYNLLTYGEIHNQFTTYGFIPDLDNWTRENAEEIKDKILVKEKIFSNQNKNMDELTVKRQGIIEDIESGIDDLLKPITKSVEPIASMIGTLGLDLLDSVTISNRSEATRIQSNSNPNQVVGVNRAILLATDQKACSRTPKGAHRMEQVHSMEQVMNIPIFRRGFTFDGGIIPTWSSSTLTEGEVLYTVPVGVNANMYVQELNGRALPMDVFSSVFDLWRGTICFEVSIAHTPFNKGVIACMFWDFQTNQTITFDLASFSNSALAQATLSGHCTKMVVEIPFRHQANRLKVYDGSAFDQCFIGTFAIVALTPLLTKEGFPTKVPIIVRSYAKNMEFSYRSLNIISQFNEQDHVEISALKFFRDDLPESPIGRKGKINVQRKKVIRQGDKESNEGMIRQGDQDPTTSEGASSTTHAVDTAGAYTHMSSGVLANPVRFGLEQTVPRHLPLMASQPAWTIADFFAQARIADQYSWPLPQLAMAMRGIVLPGGAMLDETMSPCMTANSRFYTYNKIRVRIQLNSMNGICGFFFICNLPGITSVTDAQNYLDNSLELLDANGALVFSIVADEEIVLDIPYQYPMKMMSTDFETPTSTLMYGFYTDTYLGASQTGNLSIVVKTSIEGFQMVEPKAPHQQPLVMRRQGDVEGAKADDATLPVSDNRVEQIKPRNVLKQIVTNKPETSNDDLNAIQLVKNRSPIKKIPDVMRDRPDSVMSTELCKVYERVLNLDISSWNGQVFKIYDLLIEHRIFSLWAMMFRFFHGGIRMKIRVMPDEYIPRAIRVGFRGMYGLPVNTSLTFQEQTLGHIDFSGGYRSNRGAFAEMQINTAGEMIDIEIPFTWLGDTITLAPAHNRAQIPGYDFGDIYIATNKRISSGVITIDISTSDDATFSNFVWLPIGTPIEAWPNSWIFLNNKLSTIEEESESDIEVISVGKTSKIQNNKIKSLRR